MTAPSVLPLSMDEAKAQCRIDGDDFDQEITALIEAAVSYLDGYSGVLGKCLMPQTWAQEFDCWQDFPLILGPVLSVDSVKYFDLDGVLQSVSASVYRVERRMIGACLVRKSSALWPLADLAEGPITVAWQAGYGSADMVPASIKQAMKLLIGHWFENREAVVVGTITSKLQMAVDALIEPHRRMIL
ncbi:MAG: head-tail connector protein [Cohaesibacter sp.]|nr:head-tail connector protein [Cohaesibacter sp.]